MSSFVKTLLVLATLALVFTPVVSAQPYGFGLDAGIVQAAPGGPQTNLEDELRRMSTEAGVIFAGQVLAVRPHTASPGVSGWVEVEFRIDQAIQGCDGQATYTLREWAGLWAGGVQRYTVGQRRLMMLHIPSTSGLSSPVGGQDGVMPLMGTGAAPGPRDSFQTAPEQAVDVRWVEARLLRGPSVAQSSSSSGDRSPGLHGMVYARRARTPVNARNAMREAVERGHQLVEASSLAAGMESPVTVPLAGTASQGITLRSILAMFSAWQAEQAHAAH